MSGQHVHIAGMLIHAKPDALDAVARLLRASGNAEIHETGVVGKLAAVIECASEREIADRIERVQAVPGVISVSTDPNRTCRPRSDPYP
jgi:nitrate reductase NapAB chaperone NapD